MPSPLRGANIEELGVRFPDMSHIYDEDLQTIVRKTALNNDIPLKDGVYLQLSGPQYESPAEITMARTLGADAVGMSTACEAVAANHMGMKIRWNFLYFQSCQWNFTDTAHTWRDSGNGGSCGTDV